MALYQSNVVFDQEKHTYTLNGKSLSGITGLLSNRLFPNKYSNISESILENARQRGSAVHAQIQMLQEGFKMSDSLEEVVAFESLKEREGLSFCSSEYLVTDNKHYASCVDLVGSDFSLYDIKTTSILDMEYLSWQLSIYAYLFNLNNEKPCNQLYAIWLRGSRAERVDVPRISDEHIQSLLDAGVKNEPFSNPLKAVGATESSLLVQARNVEERIIEFESSLKELKKQKEELINGLMPIMQERGIKSLETEHLRITLRKESERKILDSKALELEHPELYERYSKISITKGTLLFKIKETN